MIVSSLDLYNYRKFQSVNGQLGLSLTFLEGLNALIGRGEHKIWKKRRCN